MLPELDSFSCMMTNQDHQAKAYDNLESALSNAPGDDKAELIESQSSLEPFMVRS